MFDLSINQLLRKCHSVSCSVSKCQNCSHFASNLQAESSKKLSTVTRCNSAKKSIAKVRVMSVGIEPAALLESSHSTQQSKTKAKRIFGSTDSVGSLYRITANLKRYFDERINFRPVSSYKDKAVYAIAEIIRIETDLEANQPTRIEK
jgi:hypothetical protein